MRIGELARQSGVAASAIRFYEEQGLLSATRAGNGYREYEAMAAERLHIIQSAKTLGFSLESIRIMLTGAGRCSKAATIEQIDIRLREVEALQEGMARQHRDLLVLRERLAHDVTNGGCRDKRADI